MDSAAHGWLLSCSLWLASPWPFPSESNGLCSEVVTACVWRALHSSPLHQPVSKQPAKVGARGCDSLVRVNVCVAVVTVGLWGFCCTHSDINGLCPKGQPCPPTATSVSKLHWDVVQVWLPAKGTVLFSPLFSVPVPI